MFLDVRRQQSAHFALDRITCVFNFTFGGGCIFPQFRKLGAKFPLLFGSKLALTKWAYC